MTPRRADFPTRLYVDRVFTLRGIGTVATGTLWSGEIAEDDRLRLEPAGRDVRVRSVQVHDTAVASATAGQRVAVSLPGVERREVRRGDALVAPGAFPRSYRLEVALEELSPIAGRRAAHGAPWHEPHPGSRRPGRRLARAASSRCPCRRRPGRSGGPARRDHGRGRRRARPRATAPGRRRPRPAARQGRPGVDRPRARRRARQGRGARCAGAPRRRRTRGRARRGAGRRRLGVLRGVARRDGGGGGGSGCARTPRRRRSIQGLASSELLPAEPWAPAIVGLLPVERRGPKLVLPGTAATLGARADAAAALERELARGRSHRHEGRRRRARPVPRRRGARRSGRRRLRGLRRGLRGCTRPRRDGVRRRRARSRSRASATSRGVGRRDAQLLLERMDADGVTRRIGDRRVLRRAARVDGR